jgi:hypothetical protein
MARPGQTDRIPNPVVLAQIRISLAQIGFVPGQPRGLLVLARLVLRPVPLPPDLVRISPVPLRIVLAQISAVPSRMRRCSREAGEKGNSERRSSTAERGTVKVQRVHLTAEREREAWKHSAGLGVSRLWRRYRPRVPSRRPTGRRLLNIRVFISAASFCASGYDEGRSTQNAGYNFAGTLRAVRKLRQVLFWLAF